MILTPLTVAARPLRRQSGLFTCTKRKDDRQPVRVVCRVEAPAQEVVLMATWWRDWHPVRHKETWQGPAFAPTPRHVGNVIVLPKQPAPSRRGALMRKKKTLGLVRSSDPRCYTASRSGLGLFES